MSNVIFIFVDGIGVAPPSDHNPFARANIPTLRRLMEQAMTPIDATLGMPGLPQSGTGQATLMTGENCARIHGAHFGPYPPSRVRPVLNEHNLFSQCVRLGMRVEFVNAYPQRYFDYLAAHPAMKPSIASSFEVAGHALHTADDLIAGRAVSADVKGERWNEMGFGNVTPISLHEAGARLALLASDKPFTMFEYWLTDKAGHKQDMPAACDALERLDGMLDGLLETMDHERTTLVITSDHGNMEDLSVPTHTLNPVPLIAVGAHATALLDGATSLMDVAPRILGALVS